MLLKDVTLLTHLALNAALLLDLNISRDLLYLDNLLTLYI